jgi:hypothetical protein
MQATTQQAIVAIVAIVQLFVVAVAAVIALLQARSHIALRRFQTTLEMLRLAQSKEVSRARWFAYECHEEIERELNKPFESEFKRLHAVDETIAKLSQGNFDLHDYLYPILLLNLTGFMITEKLVEPKIVLKELGSTFLRTWEAHKTFIHYRRKQRFLVNERLPRSFYGHYLEAMVKRIRPPED